MKEWNVPLPPADNEVIILGNWSEEKLDGLITQASAIKNIGERVAFLSGQFLDAPYEKSTLIGTLTTPETLVINIETFDCFTFLDCIEAMRLSRSRDDFHDNIIRIRYKDGLIRYKNRNHFFTDWSQHNSHLVQDKTKKIGGKKIKTVTKIMNRIDDGSCLLPGIGPFERTISYIPSEEINVKATCTRLQTGDYVGIFSNLPGLDVSHVGIIVKDGPDIYFRHASSIAQKVVDQDFSEYIAGRPGIIILRPY